MRTGRHLGHSVRRGIHDSALKCPTRRCRIGLRPSRGTSSNGSTLSSPSSHADPLLDDSMVTLMPLPPLQHPATEMDMTDRVHQFAFTSYLQSVDEADRYACSDATAKLLLPDDAAGIAAATHQVWARLRAEALEIATAEPLLVAFLHSSILQHDSLEDALVFVLATSLGSNMLPTADLARLFKTTLQQDPSILCGALADMEAFCERDPACTSYTQALLHRKGYHGIQAQRIAHSLWARGQKVVALAIQSRMSEVYAVDIHPGAVLGHGLLLDHGTGVVIGETAVIGNNCSLMQSITLGGTGKETGDRHPKIRDNVLIGASSTILGNIVIGKGAQVGAGSLVLKDVAPHTMVVGSPSAVVGRVTGNPALRMQHYDDKFMSQDPFRDDRRPGTVSRAARR